MGIYDKSGFGDYAPPVGSALAPSGIAGVLTGVGGIVSGVAPLLGVAGGLSDMFGGGMDISKAVSGGTFVTGEFATGKSQASLIIIVAVVLGLLIIFRGKK